jgi:hypothetical protein
MSAAVFREWLDSGSIAELEKIAHEGNTWQPGRQGTGYEIMPLDKKNTFISYIIQLAAVKMGCSQDTIENRLDAYLIRYKEGSFIPQHRDVGALFGHHHARFNAIVTSPSEGGELYIGPDDIAQHIELKTGDAYFFWPDKTLHRVSAILRGERLVLSIGVLLPESEAKHHRFSGWPGAYCLDCGAEDAVEVCLANHPMSSCKRCDGNGCDTCSMTGCSGEPCEKYGCVNTPCFVQKK